MMVVNYDNTVIINSINYTFKIEKNRHDDLVIVAYNANNCISNVCLYGNKNKDKVKEKFSELITAFINKKDIHLMSDN